MHWAARSGSVEACAWVARHEPRTASNAQRTNTGGSQSSHNRPAGEEEGGGVGVGGGGSRRAFPPFPNTSLVTAPNAAGWRPLHLATQHEHESVCVWLVANGALEYDDHDQDAGRGEEVGHIDTVPSPSFSLSQTKLNVDLPMPLPATLPPTSLASEGVVLGRQRPLPMRLRVRGQCQTFLEVHDAFVHGFTGVGSRTNLAHTSKVERPGDAAAASVAGGGGGQEVTEMVNSNNVQTNNDGVEARRRLIGSEAPRLIASFLFELNGNNTSALGPTLRRFRAFLRAEGSDGRTP